MLVDQTVGQAIENTTSIVELSLDDEIPGGHMRIRYGLSTDPNSQSQVFIVDADCFILGRFGHDELFGGLNQLNNIAGRFFRWAITDLTTQALRPSALEPLP